MALCPSHKDKRPSLKVSESDGKILIHCWAGCRPSEIVRSLNLRWGDLFSTPNGVKPISEEQRIATAVVDSIRKQLAHRKEGDREAT